VLSFGGTTPTPASLNQASNLDNNTGAPTREVSGVSGEQGLTNLATVGGTYTGNDINGVPNITVVDSDTETVTSEDLALHKSVTTQTEDGTNNGGQFSAGGIATYTLTLRTGEYADASNIVLTDVIPDGLCPLDDVTNHAGTPECAPAPEFAPVNGNFASVTHNPGDGTFTIEFNPVNVPHNDTLTLTYVARMRANYVVHDGDPTVSGDDYTNNVDLNGTTTTLTDVNAPEGPGNVLNDILDDSSATITSDGPALDKSLGTNTGVACTADTYDSDPDPSLPANTYSTGDRICFKVRVDFSLSNSTRNPVLADLLPANVDYVSSTVSPGSQPFALSGESTDAPVWEIGTPNGSNRFVPKGGFFEVIIEGQVTAPASGPAPDITGNLAKLVWVDTDGTVGFLRDQVDFSVAAIPPVSLSKAAERISGAPTGPLSDGALVGSGEVLEYTVSVTNDGNAANRNDENVIAPDVWDVLPDGITCTDISAI
ncbi:MAG TPA: hypothetical protein PKM12_08045, partial [Marmoricola sp.]|nr:hypothetical protein [Marmoricola sp.]